MKGWVRDKEMLALLKTLKDPKRYSGRTTHAAFMHLCMGIENPELWIPVKDHYETHEANKHLFSVIHDMVTKLELNGWYFDSLHLKIMFVLDEPEVHS